ncbi:non-hydrolyzing UDP-N-acetylglucosamine 2-epimerase [Flavobacterium sp. TMP13]|uniref:non-hydrolyzing UDP-N-acetylglucosamine 2-epimerase n=1 Tax=Flavobacterium sp. TMP13 TaxID=3425950 RepID=UPI003D7831E5
MEKILLCFGTRPEAIKMAPLYHKLKLDFVDVRVCVTAQHREMLDQVLGFFEIVPDYDLNLMKKNQSLNELSSRILQNIDKLFDDFKPDIVLVHGDTTTSLIVSLAAFYRQINIGHVEAGLRTYNKKSPFPEEINRQLTGRLADLHFAPTKWASENLMKEGICRESIFVTGNTVIDALGIGLKKIDEGYLSDDLKLVKSLINPSCKIILVTGHRRESFGKGFENLCLAIKEIAQNKDVQVIYPLHLNPNIQIPIMKILDGIDNVHLINPIDYPSFLFLMNKAYLIMTDSGGVQEEAPSLGKPILLLRSNTERPEALSTGNIRMVGMDKEKIVENVIELLKNRESYLKMSQINNPYGDGKASERITEILKMKLGY